MDRKEESIEQQVDRIQNDLIQLKTVQPIGGKSLITNTISSSLQYDFYMRIFETDPVQYRTLNMNYSGPGTDFAMLRLMIFVRADNPDVMADPIPFQTPTAPPAKVRWKRIVPLETGVAKWRFQIVKGQVGVPYYDLYFKFYINGTSGGSF